MRHKGKTGINFDCFDCALCCQDHGSIKCELLLIDSTATLCLSRWRCRMKTIPTWIDNTSIALRCHLPGLCSFLILKLGFQGMLSGTKPQSVLLLTLHAFNPELPTL